VTGHARAWVVASQRAEATVHSCNHSAGGDPLTSDWWADHHSAKQSTQTPHGFGMADAGPHNGIAGAAAHSGQAHQENSPRGPWSASAYGRPLSTASATCWQHVTQLASPCLWHITTPIRSYLRDQTFSINHRRPGDARNCTGTGSRLRPAVGSSTAIIRMAGLVLRLVRSEIYHSLCPPPHFGHRPTSLRIFMVACPHHLQYLRLGRELTWRPVASNTSVSLKVPDSWLK
jgi:hypothetical protein